MASDARDALTKEPFPLPAEWRWLWLDEVMSIRGGAQPPAEEFHSEPGPGRVRFVQIRDFDGDGHITFIDDSPKWRHCSPDDILIARYGASLGRILTGLSGAYNVALVKASPLEGVGQGYLLYLLKSPFFQGPLAALSARSVQAGFNKRDLANIPVPVPPLPVQRRIADVLGKLDNRIELNRRMSRTLGKMAAAIFKSWFIDFDPVHAKVEGRGPNLPAEIAHLFPDGFEDSDLGPIPKGWGVGPLSELAKLTTKSVKPREQPEAMWEHYSIPAYDEGQQPHHELGETIKSGKYSVPEISVLVSKLNPRFPRVWLPHVTDPARAICSTEFMPFVACRDHWRPFIYEMMRSHPVQGAIKAHATGSTGSRQRVKPKEIAGLAVITPPPSVIDAFTDMIIPLYDRVLLNRRQNRRLAGLRDTLLPKLVSGEFDLPKVGAIAEEMAL